MPTRILAGDAYLVTQGSGPYSVNESLAESLKNRTAHPWAEIVSPEILSLGTAGGEPVVVRAADPAAFFSLEGGVWVQAGIGGDRTAFAGEGLVRRLGLAVGDDVTLVGSSVPRIAFVRIAGIYRTATPANDELLVDFSIGRLLSGLGATGFHSIRIRTTDPAALLNFLRGTEASVHVTGPGLPRVDIASDPPTDERISNLILRTGIGGAPRDYLASAVAEATNSVGVVAYGIAVLLGILVAFGIHAVQARAFADRVPAVGVLRAIGAGNRWMRRRLVAESLPLAAGAAILGAGLGFVAETSLQPNANLIIFGHTVLVSFDLTTFALVVLAVVATSMLSSLWLLRNAMAARPVESIRETPAVAPPQSLEAILRG
ncbi:MAG TPA: FtsX-like permease family protein [Thermoplasmata archaeon]|nr:FtsX-like permease family protein [Thermoplasmata archaeon]